MKFIKFLTLILLVGCTEVEDKQKLQTVRYQEVISTSGIQQRSFSGKTRASIESKLSFRVPGIITSLPVKIGDEVNTGDVIATLDNKDYSLQLEEAEASLLRTIAQERQATADYSRIRDLYETKSASKAELDAARAQAESAIASTNASEKKLELAEAQLSYATLHAPIDGGIAAVEAEVNENVATGQTIVIINSKSQVEVSVAIPELIITKINEGDSVEVTFDAIPGETFPAVVSEVGVSSITATAFPVTVKLLKDNRNIRSGMAAEVAFSLLITGGQDAIFVPTQSVSGDEDGQRFVFVLLMNDNGRGRVQKRVVNIGQITNEGIEITEGLNPGELIIVAGVQFLSEGQEVEVMNSNEVSAL
ncbi:MAG: efflux RND transporter periplasmic adaptor subunit [Chlamydiota bacterium]|nr:efflux RND transporter periplasmic adaptor subunit [Chlamydiota bacterium]